MRKRFRGVLRLSVSGSTAVLLLLSAAFLIGAVAGCILVNRVGGEGGSALEEFLSDYLSSANTGELYRPGVLSLLWEVFRWPLLILFLGVTPLGTLALPALFFVRGFLLSFSIASFFRALGSMGLALAFVLFGFTGLLSVPVLFVLGVQSCLMSGAVAGRLLGEARKGPLVTRETLLRCGGCAAILCLCCFLEYHLVPVFVEPLAALLLS